jgi:cytochrome c peroxidase
MRYFFSKWHLLPVVALLLFACSPKSEQEGATAQQAFALPDDPTDADGYSPIKRYEPMHVPADNPITLAKAQLGRQLYYDYRLSGDGSRSCYHCHVVEHGLTDGLATAVGAHGKALTRSSPTMWNVGYLAEWYWDGRAKSLEGQAKAAWIGANMGATNADSIVALLNSIAGYSSQFQTVFGEPATQDNVPKALATFMRTIISDDTPWDRWRKGDSAAVSPGVKRGFDVFKKSKCDGCHSGVLFTDQQFHNVGIGMDKENYDVGRFKVTNLEQDRGAFKTPTLRDIAKSAPYFHDGSTPTLIEAVKVVLAGGRPNPYLDARLKAQSLTDQELADLLEFLGSLSQPSDYGKIPDLPHN